MERKIFKTLVKNDHAKFGGNKYVIGRISGIGYMISALDIEHGNTGNNEGFIYINEFTTDEYENFKQIIEKLYPGLCEFNYQERKEG